MGFWDTVKKVGRVGIGIGTGGASEVAIGGYNAATGKGGLADGVFGGVKQAQAGDSSNYDYGGDPEYAKNLRAYLGERTQDATQRTAYQMDRSAADAAMAGFGGAMGNDGDARYQQRQALDMYRSAAEGKGPSVAASQMQAGLEESSRLGQNMAAGAVGANPLLASTNAAGASADAARRSTSAAAALRAQEIDAARAGYAGLASGMRSADQAAADRWLSSGQFGMGVEGQQAGLEMQQRGLNDAQQQAYENFQLQVNRDALAGRMGYGNAQTSASQTNANNSVARRGQNQQAAKDTFEGIKGVAMGAAGV
jgi:hypothetical protein